MRFKEFLWRMVSTQEYNRMRWAARRGMLELDLMLEPFVTQRYRELGDEDRAHFARLMECEDQELYAWMLQRGAVEDEDLAALVQQIIQFARTRPEAR